MINKSNPKLINLNLITNAMILRGGYFRRLLGYEVFTPRIRIIILSKKGQQELAILLCEDIIYEVEIKSSSDTGSVGNLILNFLSSRTMSNKFFDYKLLSPNRLM